MPAVERHPSRAALLTELPRAGLDVAALAAAWPLLAAARRGDSHPVLVLPGLMTGDPATVVLRTALRALGHDVSGWSLGINRGPTGRVVDTLRAQLERLHRTSGRRVSLVGWSLGGLYAQELARAAPGSVRGLVTLGTPVVRSETTTAPVVTDTWLHSQSAASSEPSVQPPPWKLTTNGRGSATARSGR